MAHWAEIDENNIVLRVVVGSNDEPDEGYQWIIDNLGGKWLKTSYNGNIRKNFAGVGSYYDEQRDAFILLKPEDSLTPTGKTVTHDLDEDTCQWVRKVIES
jgi:hypothetical protein